MFRALRPFKLEGKRISKFDLLPSVPSHLEGTFLRAGFIEPADEPEMNPAEWLANLGKPDLAVMKKADLLALAAERGLEVSSKMRVSELRDLLKEGVT